MPATLLLTPQLADQLAEAVEAGVPIETACQAAGISRVTFYDWLQTAQRETWHDGSPVKADSLEVIVAFASKVQRASAAFEAKRITAIARAAEAVNEKTGIPEWRAGAWLLNNHPRYRSTYRQERISQVEQTGTVRHEHSLAKALEPEQLAQAYAALEPGPEEPAGLGT